MIPNATLILGPPGCGKTYTLIERVQEKLQEGVHPSRIGVVSFTTKDRGFRVMNTKLHPKTKVIDGVLAKESKSLIDDFFKKKRELK